MKYIANYRSSSNEIFCCPLTFHNGAWKLATAHGVRDFTYYLQEDLSPSGWLEFSDVVLSAPGLRPGDFVDSDFRMRQKLAPFLPKKPAEPVQQVNTETDSVPKFPRLDGESDRAFFARAMRERDAFDKKIRTEVRQTTMDFGPDPKQIAKANAAQAVGAESLRVKKPRGGGGGFEIEGKK